MDDLNSEQRFLGLLRELFQLEHADLDFGIYRLFHLKRAEVEAFLTKQLPFMVADAFAASTGEERERAVRDLDDLRHQVRESIAEDAILPNGDPKPEHAKAKLVQRYTAARDRLASLEASEAQKAEVFNLLYTFFARYYDAGDFIPRRFYGERAHYAVPYQGQEVYFHWANRDQHYIKTGEAFRDYAFTVKTIDGQFRVRFQLTKATEPPGNTKGNTRFFFPVSDQISYDKLARELTLPFVYRLPTEAELQQHGSNSKGQDSVLTSALDHLFQSIAQPALRAALSSATKSPGSEEEVPLLLRRLRHFTKRNTTDYFIHKNLGAFLHEELEFFIKDQVLHFADLDAEMDGKRRTLRVFRTLANSAITFIAQIENAQRLLYCKKKFVLRTDYLIPIQLVPRVFWPEIMANDNQVAAWKSVLAFQPTPHLFNATGTLNEAALDLHPTLVVNTAHFDRAFFLRVEASLDNIDEVTDGFLVHADNYQALQLLRSPLSHSVRCVFIDPPYNTGSDDFIYKDRYKRSSWIAMMSDRLLAAQHSMRPDAAIFVTIDDAEITDLRQLMDATFGRENELACVVWQHSVQPKGYLDKFSVHHNYVVTYRASDSFSIEALDRTDEHNRNYSNPDNDPKGDWRPGDVRNAMYRPNLIFDIPTPSGKIIKPPANGWRWSKETVRQKIATGEIKFSDDETRIIRKIYLRGVEGRAPETIWFGKDVGTTREAARELKDLFGDSMKFETAKPTKLIRRVLELSTESDTDDWVLDFFAGSGTTGHAVINLNRADGGRRRFVLVESAPHFDSILLPRIQKVMFAPEWKDGAPERPPTKDEVDRTPRLIKVIRLESFDDALHNTFSEQTTRRSAEREHALTRAVGDHDFRLRYFASVPRESSDSVLTISRLEHPADYAIETLTNEGPRLEAVDLVESFNWFYGLRVRRTSNATNENDRTTKDPKGRSYLLVLGTDRDQRKRVLVIWRDMTGLDPKVERAFLEKQIKGAGEFDEIWINGDSAVPGVRSLDGLFKRLMEADDA